FETVRELLKKYPKLKVVVADGDLEVNSLGESTYRSKNAQKTISDVINSNQKGLDFLFVALGHIKQEKWISKNLPQLNVKVAMGVGGAFDYLSGSVPRAPLFIRNLGLEWLFRLIVQPWRIFRILRLVKYIWLLIFNSKFKI
ncbi:MAG: Glycosyl transferase, WecB/TagA/CpsF family, partial [Candidatus Daviesbacteria bacterium GW2011_GWA1_36_8]